LIFGWIILVVMAYTPVLYKMNNRIRVLEGKIKELDSVIKKTAAGK
jgi:hypothetical protein